MKVKDVPEEILAFVDDSVYKMTEKARKKFKLSWKKARDHVNNSIRLLFVIDNQKCEDCGVKIKHTNWGMRGLSPKGIVRDYCCSCIDKINKEAMKNRK